MLLVPILAALRLYPCHQLLREQLIGALHTHAPLPGGVGPLGVQSKHPAGEDDGPEASPQGLPQGLPQALPQELVNQPKQLTRVKQHPTHHSERTDSTIVHVVL